MGVLGKTFRQVFSTTVLVSFQTWSIDSSLLSLGVNVSYLMPVSSRKAEMQPWAFRELAELAAEP